MAEPLAETDEIIHKPNQAFVESTNVRQFMQEHGIDNYEELIERTTTDVENVEGSGVDWFWDELVDYLGIEFYEDYDTVRDDSGSHSAQKTRSAKRKLRGRFERATPGRMKPRTATARSSPTGTGGEFASP